MEGTTKDGASASHAHAVLTLWRVSHLECTSGFCTWIRLRQAYRAQRKSFHLPGSGVGARAAPSVRAVPRPASPSGHPWRHLDRDPDVERTREGRKTSGYQMLGDAQPRFKGFTLQFEVEHTHGNVHLPIAQQLQQLADFARC